MDAEEAKEMRLQPKPAEEQEGMSTSQTAEEESAVENWRENRQEENIMKASPGMSDGPASMMPMPLTMMQQVLKNVLDQGRFPLNNARQLKNWYSQRITRNWRLNRRQLSMPSELNPRKL